MDKLNVEKSILIILCIDTLLLLFFGKPYSKLLLIEPFFYLHDVVLITASVYSLVTFNFWKNRLKSIEIIGYISLFYLAYSIVHLSLNNQLVWYYVLRQFMVFGYMISIYLILKKITDVEKVRSYLFQFIVVVGIASVCIQILYANYLYFFKSTNPFFERYYMSPLIVMGLMVGGAFVMVTYKKLKKQLLFLLVLITSFTTGHDSAYLSLIVIYFGYYFFSGTNKTRWYLILGFLSFLLVVFILAPTFTDVNMQWRIIYWKAMAEEIFFNNFGVFGNGFGIPFLNNETINELNNLMINAGHPYNIIIDDENFLSAPHNSFLSLMFHVGFWVIILILYPIKDCLKPLKKRSKHLFILFLSMIGLTVWALFNVILELPHSSSFYWVVYFLLAYELKNQEEVYE